ncbi:TonB-dependent receptor [Coraliomargarita sp. SDUM461003]|uniref:TonB-dependent receptor n=1 Tax=Thalassobacterium maritimum TaxID=3041265 RepID=A0ABU1AXD7_9BACT|nr:TonB-dependent receptor [Coraliomargarita sp. SDUM461003]MDQ8207652.1 TonB-dependent receptor [Coraliomargarita sp. SDUM461003]
MIPSKIKNLSLLAFTPIPLLVIAEGTQTLPTLYIDAQQTANIRPVTTYESPVSNLEFEPRVDLQSRNMSEAQGDVTIRGGIFESTGFRVGSATLIDPQTGHYFAELPIAPEMLERAEVFTGIDNALYGFNSTVGTITYGWSQIADGGSLTVGGGDHDLNFQRIHHGMTGTLGESGEWSWGIEAEVSRSESDGTLEFGDSDFNRTTGRAQILGPNSQTDFFAGYQSKNFTWPNMYTPPAGAFVGAIETEKLKTRLFMLNHQQTYGNSNWFEITAYHRINKDNYLLDATGFDYTAEHETSVSSLGVSGQHEINEQIALNYSAQLTADEIDSTSLVFGDFNSRSYRSISFLPQYRFNIDERSTLTVRAGATYDDSNRNESELSPIADITWKRVNSSASNDTIYLSYAETSQLAGYTAINGSDSSGVFQSNYELDRETSKNLELGSKLQRAEWSLEAAIFYRWDQDLVDWTYESNPFARSANPVDIETFGVELIGTKRWGDFEGIASYTHLHKDEDYNNDAIVGSFYALNYAKHRVTLGAIWRPNEIIEIRIDNEWRENEANALRNGSDSALFTHFGLSIYPPSIKDLELFFAIDNAWDDGFEDVPGTPGRGDQYSAGATFRW